MPTYRSVVAGLVDQFDPKVRDGFLEAIDDLRSKADLQRVAQALAAGDLHGAVEALNLDRAAFDALDQAIVIAFRTAGVETLAGLPAIAPPFGGRLVIRFDARNIRAEDWLRSYSSALVTRIVEDQREAVRVALEDGMARGINPRTVGLDIVGRINPASGKREGGIIGLTAPQAEFVVNARAELLSGDPKRLRNYLGRTRRDKRFDATVKRAIADGKPVAAADAARIVQRYKDRLLQLRGEMVGRTEAMSAVNGGHYEAGLQIADSGAVARSAVKRAWRSAGDRRVRHTHVTMHGQVAAIDAQFVSPSGARLKFPGDPAAPAAERIGCRCDVEMRVDYLRGVT